MVDGRKRERKQRFELVVISIAQQRRAQARWAEDDSAEVNGRQIDRQKVYRIARKIIRRCKPRVGCAQAGRKAFDCKTIDWRGSKVIGRCGKAHHYAAPHLLISLT